MGSLWVSCCSCKRISKLNPNQRNNEICCKPFCQLGFRIIANVQCLLQKLWDSCANRTLCSRMCFHWEFRWSKRTAICSAIRDTLLWICATQNSEGPCIWVRGVCIRERCVDGLSFSNCNTRFSLHVKADKMSEKSTRQTSYSLACLCWKVTRGLCCPFWTVWWAADWFSLLPHISEYLGHQLAQPEKTQCYNSVNSLSILSQSLAVMKTLWRIPSDVFIQSLKKPSCEQSQGRAVTQNWGLDFEYCESSSCHKENETSCSLLWTAQSWQPLQTSN